MSDNKVNIIDLGKVAITISETPWNAATSYERMTMVYHSQSGDCFISLKDNFGVNPVNDATRTWVKVSEHGHSMYEIAVEQGKFIGTEEQFAKQYADAIANMQATVNEWNNVTKPIINEAVDSAKQATINADIATAFANEQGNRAKEIADLANPVLNNLNATVEAAQNAQTSAENAAQSAADAQSNLQDIYDKIDEVGEETVAIAALQNEVSNLQTNKFDKVDVVQKTGDNEDKVMSQKAVTNAYGSLEDNPEFINVVTDFEGKILEGIKEDGTKYFPNKIQQGGVYSEITNNPEYLFVYTDSTDKMLFGIKADGSVEFQKGIPTPIKNELERLENTLNALTGENLSDAIENVKEILSFLEDIKDNEKLIEKLNLINERLNTLEDKTEELDHIDNPEFIEATLDADGKVLEGIKSDGTKYFPNKIQQGDISTEIIENPEYSEVTLDASGKVIEGLTKDGQKYLGKPSNQDELIQNQVSNQEERLEVVEDKTQDLSHSDNPEFIEVTLDNDGKLLEGIKEDGTKYFATKISHKDVVEYDIIDNPEYTEVVLDSEDKIIECTTIEGEKQINIQHTFNKNTIFNDKAIFNKEIKFNDISIESVIASLKDAGFTVEQIVDLSNESYIHIPIPQFALVNIITDKIPNASGQEYNAVLEFKDRQGNYFRKDIEAFSIQGRSSRSLPKKNFGFDFTDVKIKFGNWVAQDSFHLKANYIDATRVKQIALYKMFIEIQDCNTYMDARPWRKLNKDKVSLTDGTSIDDIDLNNEALGLPDGFPFELQINGEFHGIYTWQLKKHRDNYCLNKKDSKNIHLDPESISTMFSKGVAGINWSYMEFRNPKNLIDMNGNDFDGDAPTELIDDTSDYWPFDVGEHSAYTPPQNEGESASKYEKRVADYKTNCTRSSQVKGYTKTFAEVMPTITSLSTLEEKKALFETHFDVDWLIDHYIFQNWIANADCIDQNVQWISWDGIKWWLMVYDIDQAFGLHWYGYTIHDMDPNSWLLTKSDTPIGFLRVNYVDEIKARYKVLRDKGILSVENFISKMNYLMTSIGIDEYDKEFTLWDESPSHRDDGTYSNFPYTGGFHESVARLELYATARTQFLDTYYDYN